jgi:hypothetical protein
MATVPEVRREHGGRYFDPKALSFESLLGLESSLSTSRTLPAVCL